MKRSIAIAAVLAAALGLAACSSSGGGSGGTTAAGSINFGAADFPESALLAHIYGDAMSAKGVKVTITTTGERAVYTKALEDGSLGAIAEYTGSILDYLDPSATAKSPAAVFAALKTVAAKKGLVPLSYAAAQDSDTITVTKATATKDHLTSIADLAPVAKNLTFGAPAAFQSRPDGIPALKSVYGVVFGTFTPLAAGGTVTQTALKNGTIDAGDIFSTDASIAANNFVSLTDPKNMFAAQNIVPLFVKSKLTQTMTDACNAVSAKLDTATLARLDAQLTGSNTDAVAKAWLSSVGLG